MRDDRLPFEEPFLLPFSKQTTKICAQAREPDGMKTMDAKADTKAGQEMTGAEMVLEALKDNGVRHIFGYPGGAVLPIYDELFQQDAIEHILVRHEQGAGHAAEGYASATGRVGVASTTCGPGFTQIMTALAMAARASDPWGTGARSRIEMSMPQR